MWTVEATEVRDSWDACDACAIDALVDAGELRRGETLPVEVTR